MALNFRCQYISAAEISSSINIYLVNIHHRTYSNQFCFLISIVFVLKNISKKQRKMAFPAYLGVTYITPFHNDIYPSIDPTSSSLAQPEKVVLLTGAGKGIGRSIALSFAKANVACLILLARTASNLDSVAAEIKELNPSIRVHTYAVDVTSEEEVQKVKEEVTKNEGRLDILINNAGASTPWVPIPESPASNYWRTFEVNLKGPFLFLHAFLPLLKTTGEKTGKGTDIINVSSIGAHAIFPGASAYQVSKFAILRLTEFVDVEFGENGDAKGVRCFAIHPGGVKTDLTANSSEAVKSSECHLM
jgi:NAD(P)-dependent dehydrogenase (short-subunit alcohol dehydrogenase family)